MQRTDRERGLGVTVEKSLKPSAQCVAAVKKANRILGYINSGIQYKAREGDTVTVHRRPRSQRC